ncbi:MAG: DUF177 domain-containing protein [bacterium]
MLKISIRTLKDGDNSIELSENSEKIDGIFSEFFGIVDFTGIVKRQGDRYIVKGKAHCQANLICDLSNEDYIELIEVDINAVYVVNNLLYNETKDIINELHGEIYMRDDDLFIDITEEVKQELIIGLPLKRIAPAYRDKKVEDLYPDYVNTSSELPEDSRWEALKKLNLN